jgi:hypothetical protein
LKKQSNYSGGIDFGDFIDVHKHIIINIGKPIEVSEYIESYEENPRGDK